MLGFSRGDLLTALLLTTTVLAACAGPAGPQASSQKKLVTVTDVVGREVQVRLPADKVILQSTGTGGAFLTLFALEQKNVVSKIAGWDNGLTINRKDMYDNWVEAVPALASLPDVGSTESNTLNIEKIITLKPDVMIITKSSQAASKDAVDKLAAAGIPTVVIDYHSETLENYTKGIQLIGQIIGQEQKARGLSEYFTAQFEKVTSRLATVNKQKPTVYVELGQDPAVYGNTYGDTFWGPLVENAGGINIAKGKVTGSTPLQPEYVIGTNPDVVLFGGSYWPDRPDSVKLGYTANPDTAVQFLIPFTRRPGWDSMSAVKNGRVHAANHGLPRDVWAFYPMQYLAKIFYPETFKDLDPDAAFREFHQKFLPVEPSGVWTLDLKKS